MLRHRKILLALSIVIVLGSLACTITYALHLRSHSLRDRIAADLTKRMGLAIEIGSITPLSFSSRQFNNLTVDLPELETRIGRFNRVVWRAEESGAVESYGLGLEEGWLLVGTGHWARDDYQRLLQSGFGHDFAALHLTEIRVRHIDFHWRHPAFSMTAPQADGIIVFDEQGRGQVNLTVYKLNETTVEEPIQVSAWFTPGAGMAFQKVEVHVGGIPLEGLGLDALLGGPVKAGTFAGRIVYREPNPADWTMEVGGSLSAARLEELTGEVIGGPFNGLVNIHIDRAVFLSVAGGRPELRSLRFGGRLAELELAQFASLFQEPELNGRIDLTVHQADFDRPDLRYVRLSGKAVDVSLEALTRVLGYGVVTGRLEVRINALAIVDNVIQFADVDVLALPPGDEPGFIEKAALASVGRQAFGLDLEPILPERVEYVQMGVKLLLDREGLRIRGTHGPRQRTILTVKLWGREVGLLKQPDKIYPMKDLVAIVRSRLKDYDVEQFIRWWAYQHAEDPEDNP